jgi:hypothetical protein
MASSTIKMDSGKILETKTVTYGKSITVSANAALTITDADLGLNNPPSGFEVMGVMNVTTGNANLVVRNFSGVTGNDNSVRNVSSSSQTGTYVIKVKYMKLS